VKFLEVSNLKHVLNPLERLYLYGFLSLSLITWFFIAWLYHCFSPVSLHVPPTFYTTVPKEVFSWLFSLLNTALYGILCSLGYIWLCSILIKRSLKRRNIDVLGWSWRGAALERVVLDEFRKFLELECLYNLDATKQLIQNARDESTADSRPSLRNWSVLAIGAAFIIAFWQAVFSRWLQSYDNLSAQDFAGLVALGTMLTLVTAQIILVFFWSPSTLRTQREIYLNSLTAIRLELLKHQEQAVATPDKAIMCPQVQIPKPAPFSLFWEVRHPFCKRPIQFSFTF